MNATETRIGIRESHNELQTALDEAMNYVTVYASFTNDAKASAFLDKCSAILERAAKVEDN